MKITELALVEVSGRLTPRPPFGEERSAKPLDVYPEFNTPYQSPTTSPGEPTQCSDVYLEVRTDTGQTGVFGPVDGQHAILLPREIGPAVLGMDPMATEKVWDTLLRRNRNGRSGYYMMAMSALDCALWDLKGKALDQPVYRLLGGPVRNPVPAYASMLGFSVEPKRVAELASAYKAKGFEAQKWFFRYGPADGAEGVKRNVAMAQAAREAVGDGYMLMFDAFNSWDAPYAVDMGRRIADLHPAWLEEPMPMDRTNGLRTIRARAGVPVATGEHAYTRWQVQTLLQAGAVDVIQADPDWCGGISELVKIATLCSAYDTPLYPHGHSLHAALHVAAASPANVVPRAEFLAAWQPRKQRFMHGFLEPQNGAVTPPDAPGLGIELDETLIETKREIA